MAQLRQRDEECAVLAAELEGLRAAHQQLSRTAAAQLGGGQQQQQQQHVAALREAERQVVALQGMVSVGG